MKNVLTFSLLICTILFSVIGCVEENFETFRPALDGDEIVFGVRAGFEDADPATKTVYSGEEYKIGTVSFERIDWLDGDKIEIYCPQTNMKQAHYSVTKTGATESTDGNNDSHLNDFAYLSRIGESSLSWNGNQPHTFYAMYPSSLMHTQDPEQTVDMGIYMNETTVYGRIPIQQNPLRVEEVGNGLICHPNMDYAYMVARNTVDRTQGGNGVGLSFVPIVTAVEIELVLPTDATAAGTEGVSKDVRIAEIIVEGDGIAGDFAVNLSNEEWTGVYPPCKNLETGVARQINISLWYQDAQGNYQPRVITAGKSIKFTVFLRPGANVKDLKISFDSGAGILGKTLTGSVIPSNKKTRIRNLHLPAIGDPIEEEEPAFEWNYANWMSQLSDEVIMNKLSLPGTGGSFSYAVTGEETTYNKSQELTFEQQWNMGIRAFEIVSDRPSTDGASIGTVPVECNKQPCGALTVGGVLNDLLTKVASIREGEDKPGECAVAILTYQPKGNSPARNATYYTQSVVAWYNSLSGEQKSLIKLYSPTMTLGDARGHLMIICRVNQRDESEAGSWSGAVDAVGTTPTTPILLVDGCGTAKDRWGARGYKVTREVQYQTRSNWYDRWSTVESSYELINAIDISNSKPSDADVELEFGESILGQYATARNYYENTNSYAEYLMGSNNVFPNGEYSFTSGNWQITRPSHSEYDYSTGQKDNGMRFNFATNSGAVCWYQDWSRVIKESRSVSYGEDGRWVDSTTGYSYTYDPITWFPSYSEKIWNIEETFRMAISDKYPDYVFVNSLCGYYGTDAYINSLIPSLGYAYGGDGGDIKGLSTDVNKEFYNFVLSSGMSLATGPTGIVMMDFVSDDPEDGGSYYLPGVIIGNNRKHDSASGDSSGDDDEMENEDNGGSGDGTGGNPGGTEG